MTRCPYCLALKEAFQDLPEHPLIKEMEVEDLTPGHEKAHYESCAAFVGIIARLESVDDAFGELGVDNAHVQKALDILIKMRELAKPYGYWPERD